MRLRKAAGDTAGVVHMTSRGLSSRWFLVGLVLLWEAGVRVFQVPVFLLPAPTMVLRTLWVERYSLLQHTAMTALECLAGFAIGNVVAIILAVAFLYMPMVREVVYPLAVAIRTIPIVAITPILLLLLGPGLMVKIAVAALITFFPTLVDMYHGLQSVQPEIVELCHVLNAGRLQVLRHIRFPASLPSLFSALKIASTSATLGAVVAEWIGSQVGIGYVVVLATYQFRGDLLFAGIVLSSALALAIFGVVEATERIVIKWRVHA